MSPPSMAATYSENVFCCSNESVLVIILIINKTYCVLAKMHYATSAHMRFHIYAL